MHVACLGDWPSVVKRRSEDLVQSGSELNQKSALKAINALKPSAPPNDVARA